MYLFSSIRTVVCKWLSSAISGSGNVHSGVLSVMHDFRGRKLKARRQQTARRLNIQNGCGLKKTKHCAERYAKTFCKTSKTPKVWLLFFIVTRTKEKSKPFFFKLQNEISFPAFEGHVSAVSLWGWCNSEKNVEVWKKWAAPLNSSFTTAGKNLHLCLHYGEVAPVWWYLCLV